MKFQPGITSYSASWTSISQELSMFPGRQEKAYVSHAWIHLGLCLSSVAGTVIKAPLWDQTGDKREPTDKGLATSGGPVE